MFWIDLNRDGLDSLHEQAIRLASEKRLSVGRLADWSQSIAANVAQPPELLKRPLVQFRYLLHDWFRSGAYIMGMLKKLPAFSKDARRILELSLITCGFALAIIVTVYGMK
jgi:hypothetical protein